MSPVVMVNVLGQHVEPLLGRLAERDEAAERLGAAPKVHLYGKKDAVFKRKMGHVNVLAPSTEAALDWIDETKIWKV
jgi:5-(carboxyamino)imidazole ribonucleotide synthase